MHLCIYATLGTHIRHNFLFATKHIHYTLYMYYMYNVQLLYIVHCMYTIYIVLKLEKILGFRHPLSQVRSYLIRFQLPQHHLTDSTPELTINLLSTEIS